MSVCVRSVAAVLLVAGLWGAVVPRAGAAWIGTDDGHVVRIDPVTHDTERFELGGVPTGMAVGGGLVWAVVR